MKPSLSTRAAVCAAAIVVLAACGGGTDDEASTSSTEVGTTVATSGPTVTIASPAPGTAIPGNVVSLDLEAKGITIAKADGDKSGKSGHYHVFIDRDPVAVGATIPREAGIVHSTDDPLVLSGLGVGSHRLVVVLGDGTHNRIGDTQAETTVKVEGPSVDASAPATSAAGQPVTVTAKVEGFSLVKADGDTLGKTGHLHVFVDRPPSPAGQPIPVEPGVIHSAATSIEVPALAAGEHTLWVVAGDGAHVPFSPMVMDKLTVTVS